MHLRTFGVIFCGFPNSSKRKYNLHYTEKQTINNNYDFYPWGARGNEGAGQEAEWVQALLGGAGKCTVGSFLSTCDKREGQMGYPREGEISPPPQGETVGASIMCGYIACYVLW